MDNIILIGMPGAGKSTLGVLLAKTLAMNFCDTDLLLQRKAGTALQDILNREGLDAFLELECSVVASLHEHNTVIATGGSVVLCPDAVAHLKQLGPLVYLNLDYNTVAKRIRNIKTRGIASLPGQTLREIFDARTPLYEACADLIVDCTGLNAETAVARVAEALQEHGTANK